MDAFSRIIGQNTAIALLRSAINQDRIAPAYLFTGIAGIGRKLTALAFAETLINDPKSSQRVRARNHPDLMWVEPTYLDKGKLLTTAEAISSGIKKRSAPQIRLEQIRAIGQFLSHPPMESKRSLVVIEDARTMPEAAANGLLKTLEEPGKATIILIAPSIESILPTLVSRCQRIPFYALSNGDLLRVLANQNLNPTPQDTPQDSKDASNSNDLIHLSQMPEIIDMAQGSPGEAIANFAQLQTIPEQILTEIHNLPTTPIQALHLAKNICKELELETQVWLLNYLQNYLWRQQNEQRAIIFIHSLETAKQQLSSYIQPRLIWEVLLLSFNLCK